jgi:hypothetical protein
MRTNLLYDSGGASAFTPHKDGKRGVLLCYGWIFQDVLTKSLCIENGISDRGRR